ncbi:MAG: hypothetical protein COA88_00515 [Kordia sp.]|nr:MAG: hypothetical protein COA88_00515 [Kordia sp.]
MKKITLLFIGVIIIKAEAQTSALIVGDSLFQLGNYSKAISFYEKDVDNSLYTQTKIARAYIGLGAHRKAIPYYENIVLKDSTQLITQYELGKLYYKIKASEKAFDYFKKLIAKDKKNPNFRYQLGLVQLQAKDKRYIESFRKAIALDPYHLKSIKQLCKHFLKKRSWVSFEKYNAIGLQHYPENEMLINYKAQASFNQQQYKKAITYFTKLYIIDPYNKFILYRLGLANHMLMKYDEAISFYEKAIHEDKTNGDYHTQIGLAYMGMESYSESYFHLIKAMVLNDVKIDAEYYNLGIWHKEQEQYGKAIKMFQKAILENMGNYKAKFEHAISADNYYKTNESKLELYENYKMKFEGRNKRNDEVVSARISHFKELIHLGSNTQEVQK